MCAACLRFRRERRPRSADLGDLDKPHGCASASRRSIYLPMARCPGSRHGARHALPCSAAVSSTAKTMTARLNTTPPRARTTSQSTTEAETRLASAARPPSSDGKWFLPSPLLVSPRRATALEPAAGCRSGGRPRFSLVAHPRSARRAGRVSSLVFGCSSWRVASARCNAGRRAAVPVPSRCEDSEALAKHRQERGAELAVPRHPARFPEN
jgi:hypothetical protein